MRIKAVIRSFRSSFLILTPVCVFLGVSSVVANHSDVDLFLLSLTLLGALCAHISVNTLNEYFDFKSGLDLTTIRTKFSGGSGSIPENPEIARHVLIVGIASLITTMTIGCFFVWQFGLAIIPIGLVGILLIITYTEWINRQPILCLIAPGLGFGTLMVVGTQFVLEGEYTSYSWLSSFVPFFLVNNLLLLNQYPDISADTKIGRKNFPIAYGIKKSNLIYALFVLGTVMVIITSILKGYFPTLSLIALLPIPLSLFSLSGAIRYEKDIGNHPQYLASNVAATIITPILLGASLAYS